VLRAIEIVIREGPRTRDMAGRRATEEIGQGHPPRRFAESGFVKLRVVLVAVRVPDRAADAPRLRRPGDLLVRSRASGRVEGR